MTAETEKVQGSQEQGPKRIPVPVFTRNAGREIFLVRNSQPEKYLKNSWYLFLPRESMGEEKPEDLHTLARDLGFAVGDWKFIGSFTGDGSHQYLVHGRQVEFEFCEFPVIGGGFNPQLIYPKDSQSIQNQLVNLEGKWFTQIDLEAESNLDLFVQKFLELSKTQ